MERLGKRRRLEGSTDDGLRSVSAFAAAKARLRLNNSASAQGIGVKVEDKLDKVIQEQPADEVGLLSNYGNGGSEIGAVDEASADEQSTSEETLLSTWAPSSQNILEDTERGIVLSLAHLQTLCCIGQYELRIRDGLVDVGGTPLTGGSGCYLVTAPATAALPIIQCLSRTGAAIQLRSLPRHQAVAERLEAFSPPFRRIWAVKGSERVVDFANDSTFEILYQASDDPIRRPLRPLQIPVEWRRSLDAFPRRSERPRTIVVTGTRATGKADLCRAVLNTHLIAQNSNQGRVFLIDLDPGHQDFGLSGQVTAVEFKQPVFGAPWDIFANCIDSVRYEIVRCHAFWPHLSQQDDKHIVACAKDLLSTCLRHTTTASQHKPAPPVIVVSLPDTTQGSGSAVALALLKALQPNNVISLAGGPPNLLADLTALYPSGALQVVPPLAIPPSIRTASELKDMHIHVNAFRKPEIEIIPLTHRKPLCISYAEGSMDFRAAAFYPDMPPLKKLVPLLTASLVSIVVLGDTAPDFKVLREQSTGLPYVNPRLGGTSQVFDPKDSHLAGVAFVRAVDVQQQVLELHLVSGASASDYGDLPASRLILVHGCFDTPGAILMEDLHWSERPAVGDAMSADLLDDSVRTLRRSGGIPYLEPVRDEPSTTLGDGRWR